MTEQTFDQAARLMIDWLDREVLSAARGDDLEYLDVDPAATFWLGRLASEEAVRSNAIGERAERLDPCAIGIRVKPLGPGPWTCRVVAGMRTWILESESGVPPRWRRSELIEHELDLTISKETPVSAGSDAIAAKLAAVIGTPGLSAEIRGTYEDWSGSEELVVQLVNTSPEAHDVLKDTHIFETTLTVSGLETVPFQLEQLPDAFRYDRAVPAYGLNVGVVATPTDGASARFDSRDVVEVVTTRPEYWNSPLDPPDLRFNSLSVEPLPALRDLVDALTDYNDQHWSEENLRSRAAAGGWSEELLAEAIGAASGVRDEERRLRAGVTLLTENDTVLQAFRLMNRAMAYSAEGRGYDSWRPFQIGFLLQTIGFLVDDAEAEIVDTVWFATGGGKTETYLGLLVTAAFFDRLTGKLSGVTAWSRFPLRLLSLQQTQRFADALAGAERVRREEQIRGAPFSLGFFVGKGSTPNKVLKVATDNDPDPDSPGMPEQYQVLMHCPFCRSDQVSTRFDRRYWRLVHECANEACSWPAGPLPFYVVDQEIFRFLPTVVLGTLDKAASISLQAAMRGLVGPPLGICSEPGHGYTYAPRAKTLQGCAVPDCPGTRKSLPMAPARFAPSLRLQDELHLLRDSLGAVDSHYESLLDHLQSALGARPAKVVASSATLTGYEKQVRVLYGRSGRVFPQPGPFSGESFWARPTSRVLRKFVAVAPRGVTLEHVSDRTIDVLQTSIRRLINDPEEVCRASGVDAAHVAGLLSYYGTNVIYGSTLYDVEAAERSLATNNTVEGINSVQLTGQTDFDDVRVALDRLENPEEDFADRLHVVAASSMLSHGVDVSRLNSMVMLGLPLGTAEFIQTSARVGRTFPGLVHVLHKIGRERDAQTFRQFEQYVRQGDRFVEPIPISRRSRRVLRLTMPGLVEARRLVLMEPKASGQRLTTLKALRDFVSQTAMSPASEAEAIAKLLGFQGEVDELLRREIHVWLSTWFTNLDDPAGTAKWPSELGPDQPMISLRDVEASAPIHD